MGIHDRDYVRERPITGGSGGAGMAGRPGGGLAGPRAWSVTTWIIVICVAVFLIDTFLPGRYVEMAFYPKGGGGIYMPVMGNVDVDRSEVVTGETPRGERFPAYRVLHPETGEDLGLQRLQPMRFFESYLHFSTFRGFLRIELWRLIGFQFLHSHQMVMHILFNMIALFFFGPLVERYLGGKRYLAFYLLCGIFGALLYVALNLGGYFAGAGVSLPGFLDNELTTPLIGASAGVFGVLMAGAFLVPNAQVLLFFILPMRLSTLAYGLLAVSVLSLVWGSANAGGHAGHLGGAIAGWYFIRNPHHLHGFFDFLGRADPTSHHYRGKGKGGGRSPSDREIDRILDKINQRGVQSLTDREKRLLQQASREDRA